MTKSLKRQKCLLFIRGDIRSDEQQHRHVARMLTQFANANGMTVVDRLSVNAPADTPEMMDAIESIFIRKRTSNDFNNVLIRDWSQLTRVVQTGLAIKTLADRLNLTFHSYGNGKLRLPAGCEDLSRVRRRKSYATLK